MTPHPLLRDLLRPSTEPAPLFVGRTYKGDCLLNPVRPAVFEHCSFTDVKFEAARGAKASLAGTRFSHCELDNCYFGPATLDLRGTSFAGCKLDGVTFMLGKLAGSDFSGAVLKNVALRRADLTGASFRGATLKRVSFERATLLEADFTDCTVLQGDFWGEPPWDGAIVSDDIRYSFAIVKTPVLVIEQLLELHDYSVSQRQHLHQLRDWLLGWAPNSPEVMIAHRELANVFDKDNFIWLLKQLKGAEKATESR